MLFYRKRSMTRPKEGRYYLWAQKHYDISLQGRVGDDLETVNHKLFFIFFEMYFQRSLQGRRKEFFKGDRFKCDFSKRFLLH